MSDYRHGSHTTFSIHLHIVWITNNTSDIFLAKGVNKMAMNWLNVSGQHIPRRMAMTIVNNILKQMPAVGQPQRKFLVMLFSTILALRGRVNFRNLSRYCDYSERTIARQFRRSLDWPDFHQRVITTALDPQAEVISAQDASFIPKS